MMGNNKKYLSADEVKQQAYGKWSVILQALGFDPHYLVKNHHCECPICGGEDRYRFDDKTPNVTYYCNQCGYGSGVDLIMKAQSMSFYNALCAVDDVLNGNDTSYQIKAVTVERKAMQHSNERNHSRMKIIKNLMKYTSRTPTWDAVGYYDSRGIMGMKGKRIENIQYGSIAYGVYGTIKRDDGKCLLTSGIVGLLSRWGESPMGAVQIYLEPNKIEPFIDDDKKFIKKPLFKAQSLQGGGVWFSGKKKGRVLHVVEGLENAVVIAKVLNTRHVVATITGALMQGLIIPSHVEQVYILCDGDSKGVESAEKLKDRYQKDKNILIQSPKAYGGAVGEDWNDLLEKGFLDNLSSGLVASRKMEYIKSRK